MQEAFIIDTVRTPRGIGKVGKGALSHLHPQQLAATVLKAIQSRNHLNTADVEDVVWSTSTQKGKQGFDLGRQAALLAGYDIRASGVTLDRFCGGGITAVNIAAATIMSGMGDVVIAGGAEMMSYVNQRNTEEANAGVKLADMTADNPRLMEMHPQSHQGVCADAIAAMEGVSRGDVDALACESQTRAKIAIDGGRFAKSVTPVYNEDGTLALDHEEFPRPDTTPETLSALKPSFQALADYPINGKTFRQIIQQKYPALTWEGVHHAGNSSGVVDGAAAVLLATKSYATAKGLKPRARIVAFANIGDCPTLMLNAPVPAAKKVLARAGLTIHDIDLWEVNEAFAVVAEKFIRDLRLDRDKVNVNGGACALGHPIGATGAILIGTVLDELERRDLKRGLVTMCAAAGMAPAIIIERV
ncbi:MAG: hypothetical protein RIR33_423 [Pseudomonadota bacterium]|jgi:acetyl-CoA C-acetyltransferase